MTLPRYRYEQLEREHREWCFKLPEVKEVADRLGVTRPFVYGLIRRGALRAISVGKKSKKIPMGAVAAYLEALVRENGQRGRPS